jgi:hypothetical protein
MLRFICSTCHSALQVSLDRAGGKASCPWCGQVMLVPSQTVACSASQTELLQERSKPEVKTARWVEYLHHTRDSDGEVIFYFVDPTSGDDRPALKSSPVKGLRRLPGAVIEGRGRGCLARYRITTLNSEYEVQMAADKADHLAKELGITLAELVPANG